MHHYHSDMQWGLKLVGHCVWCSKTQKYHCDMTSLHNCHISRSCFRPSFSSWIAVELSFYCCRKFIKGETSANPFQRSHNHSEIGLDTCNHRGALPSLTKCPCTIITIKYNEKSVIFQICQIINTFLHNDRHYLYTDVYLSKYWDSQRKED